MIVKMFQSRFAPLVRSGEKRQTVRPWPKRMPKVGDIFEGRKWSGKPYRSKHLLLRRSTVRDVVKIEIRQDGVLVFDGIEMPRAFCELFAFADGFKNYPEMFRWFRETHGLPFKGIAIYF